MRFTKKLAAVVMALVMAMAMAMMPGVGWSVAGEVAGHNEEHVTFGVDDKNAVTAMSLDQRPMRSVPFVGNAEFIDRSSPNIHTAAVFVTHAGTHINVTHHGITGASEWIEYELGGQFEILTGIYGRLDAGSPDPTIIFVGDGVHLASFDVADTNNTTEFSLDVTGISVLRIVLVARAVANVWGLPHRRAAFVANKMLHAPVLYGDVDGNGRVEPFDATLIARYLAGHNVRHLMVNYDAARVTCRSIEGGQILPIDATAVSLYLVGRVGALPWTIGG